VSGAVHVIAPPAPTVSPRGRATDAACVLLADALSQEREPPRVVCLGPRSAERSLAAFGINIEAALPTRHGPLRPGKTRLARLLADAREVHAWGLDATLATLAASRPDATIHAHVDDAPPAAIPRRALANAASFSVYDTEDAEAWLRAGIPGDHLRVIDPKPVAPADDRRRLRAALGIHPDAVVLAALQDPGSTLDARRFVFRIGFLELLNRPTVALFPSTARRLAAARRFRSAASLRFRMLITDAPIAAVLPACDALAPLDPQPGLPAPARGAGNIVAAHAIRLGVPVAHPIRSAEPAVVSKEMAEFMAPLIERIDRKRDERATA